MWAVRDIRVAVQERLPFAVIAHFFVYVAGRVATSSISVIMAPIMMVLLSPADYGLYSLIHSFNNIAIAFIGLGLPQVLMVEYFHAVSSDRAKVVNGILFTYLTLSVPLAITCMMYPRLIQEFLFLPVHYSTLVCAIVLICFFSFLNDIMYQLLQYNRYARVYTLIQFGAAALTALLYIICIGYFHLGVASAVWSQFGTVFVVFCIGCCFYYVNGFYKGIDRYMLAGNYLHNLKLGVPFLPSMMVGWLFALVNRWMLVKYAGLELAGIYAIADAGGQLFYRVVLYPLQGSYGPALLRSYSSSAKPIHEIEKSNHQIMALMLIGMIGAVLIGYFLFKSLLYSIIPVAYARSVDCVLGVLIGYIFLIGAYFVSNLIQFQKKRLIFVIAISAAAFINIALNILLIPMYGLSGCVSAMAMGYATYFGILLWYNRSIFDRSIGAKRVV